MLNLDPAKILVILVVALIVLGPERLPRVARQLGSAWRELTRFRAEMTEEVRSAFPLDDLPKVPTIPNASRRISSFVAGLSTAQTPSEKSASEIEAASEASWVDEPEDAGTHHRPPAVVVHPALGDFAFLPDDPSMN